jgi:polysaccharide deacetylase family protein (PEP-CTERM system associated)
MLNALTVDVEDYYQVTAFERRVQRREWDRYPSRVVDNTRRILRLFDRHQVRGTFFILGWVADRFPGLVREIVEAGHEPACHSFWHRLVYALTPEEFADDLRLARDTIENAAGTAVTAYRAPSFSITEGTRWAPEILCAEGFRCDSSIFPIRHHRYGNSSAIADPHVITTRAGPLWEFPLAVYRAAGVFNLPVAGGGYFRLYPVGLTDFCLRRINQDGSPFVFYVHPWELDPEQPSIGGSGPLARWRHRVNLRSTEEKLDWLIGRFRFGRLREVLAERQTAGERTPVVAPAGIA